MPAPRARVEGQAPAVVVDALLGTGVALAIALIIAAAQGGDRPPDLLAYLFAAGFGAAVLARRRAPRRVLVATVVGSFGYHALEYPPIGVAVPIVAALFAAADAGLVRWAVGAGAVVFGVSLAFRLGEGEPAALLLGYEAVSNLALIAAAIALGDALRIRRATAAQHAEIIRLTVEQAARAAEERLLRERERISRELHDSIGHTLAVVSLHAGVAADATDDPVVARAVEHIRAASSDTLDVLRATLRLLRSATAPPDQALSLAAVPALLEGARDAGLQVETRLDDRIDAIGLPPALDAAALRIVQEALTNSVRHARATHVRVTADIDDGHLALTISDDGRGAQGPRRGIGLNGMTERVRLLGGTLHLETSPGRGFTVRALLPLAPPDGPP